MAAIGIWNLGTMYLLVYNTIQFLGWLYILLNGLVAYASGQSLHEDGLRIHMHEATQHLLLIFQTLALLEIVHAAVGLVRSPVFTTTMQLYSRNFIIWAVTYSVPQAGVSIGVPIYVFAWALTEVIRYPFYALNLFNRVPYFLTWCRYSFFIVLYPTGVLGELLTTYNALSAVKRDKVYTLEMPNAANISFSFYYYLIFFMLLYIPFFPQLYFYMLAQRRKVLGGIAPGKKTT